MRNKDAELWRGRRAEVRRRRLELARTIEAKLKAIRGEGPDVYDLDRIMAPDGPEPEEKVDVAGLLAAIEADSAAWASANAGQHGQAGR